MIVDQMVLKAVAWTLVHSLWEGIVLALLAGLVILFTKKSAVAASLRYNLLSGLFLLFIAGIGITFSYQLKNEYLGSGRGLDSVISEYGLQHGGGVMMIKTTTANNLYTTVINYLNEHAENIVLIWFLIFFVKCLGVFSEFRQVYRIRNYKTLEPEDYWKNRLAALAGRIHLKKTVLLLESRLVRVPSVVGFFKPMILVPIGMLSSLPHDQIEAILLHELAHIRRKDYFVNLLQHFAEIVFFFNPGVLWLSSLIKDERENCCDDIAVKVTGSKAKFVHALVSFEEYSMKSSGLIMGFGKDKNHLLDRAKRIIYDNNKTLNHVEKTLLSVSLVLIALIVLACSNTNRQTTVDGITPASVLTEEQVNNMTDSTSAAADRDYRKEREKLAAEAAAVAKKYKILEEKYAGKRKGLGQKEPDSIVSSKITTKSNSATDTKAGAQVNSVCSVSPNINAKVNTITDTKVDAKINPPIKKKEKSMLNKLISYVATSNSTYEKTSTTDNNGKKVKVKVGVTSNSDLPQDFNADVISKGIIEVLVKENVIKDVTNLSYKLSAGHLIVNGKEQNSRIHQLLKAKYLNSLTAAYYNYQADR